MSFAAQSQRARSVRHSRLGGGGGLPLVHGYDPVRHEACRQLGVPYGEVYVDGYETNIRSHEMHLDGHAGVGTIPPFQAWVDREDSKRMREKAFAEREARRAERESAGLLI